MGAPTESEEKGEGVRARLWSELARGRAGSVPRVMGSIQTESRPDDGVVIDRLMLAPESASEGTEHAVPVAIVRPYGDWDDKLPVVAFLHGTGGDTEGLMPSLIAIAVRGYIAVGVDAPCHGRRLDPGSSVGQSSSYNVGDDVDMPAEGLGHGSGNRRERTFERYGAALVAAWRGEEGNEETNEETNEEGNEGRHSGVARPFLYDGAWDALRALRFVTRGDDYGDLTDPSRVAISGISLGGMYAWLAGAADPSVVTGAVATIIGVQQFAWGLLNQSWRARVDSLPPALFATAAQDLKGNMRAVDAELVGAVYRRICPGLIDELDGPSSLPLIAPRPLLVVNGELDPRCPYPGLMNAVTETRAAYASANKDKLFRTLVQRDTPHMCTSEMSDVVNRWLDETLRPQRPATPVPTKGNLDPATWIEL